MDSKQPKKILFCSPKSSVGGITQWTQNILSYVHQINDEDVILDWYYPKSVPNKVPNQTLPFSLRIFKGIINYIPFVFKIRKKISNEKFSVAHFSTSGSLSFFRDFLVLKFCKRRHLRTILHFHFGRIPEILSCNSIEKKLFIKCIPYVDDFIAIDYASYNALIEHGCRNVHYVPNPLSDKIESIIRSLQSATRDENLIVFAGHVTKAKGIYELLDVCLSIENIRLEILGPVSDEVLADLKNQSGTAFGSRIFIRGKCPIEEVIKRMSNCTIFVLPSYSEGFPNVIIESMACCCPTIATNVGAIPEMLEDCGLLIPPKDKVALKEAIQFLLNNPDYAKQMGEVAGQKVRREYSIYEIWKKLKEIWIN